jgi:nicotinamidase-related amidase
MIIDVQVDMFDPSHPVAGAESLLERLLQLIARSRAARVPIVFVRNCGRVGDSDERGTPGWELHPALMPTAGDLVVDKTTGDAFASTLLNDELRRLGVSRLVIAGLQSEYCIRDTALGALARGYQAILVSDGHSTYDGEGQSAQERGAAVNAELQGRLTLLSTEEVSFA